MEPHCEWFAGASGFEYRRVGGLARIKTLVDRARRQNSAFLFCDNGDTLHGTAPLVRTRGKIILPVLKEMGLSAMTAHWEFAYGPQALIELTKELPYPMLAMNVYRKSDGVRPFPAYTIQETDGIRIAILGIACNIVDKTMPPSYSEGVRFTDGIEELPVVISEVQSKESPDLIVLLSHLGFPQDQYLLSRTTGVDVCLSSHTHNRLYAPVIVGKTIIVQSGCHGSFLTRLELELGAGGVTLHDHELIRIDDSIVPHAGVNEIIEHAMKPYRDELDEVVGSVTAALNRATMLESTADTFLLQSIQAATGVRVVFSNGWRFGAPVPRGSVTVNDLYNLTPMDPEISVTMLKGCEIREMIEENLERTFSREPMQQMGGYVKRCLGLKVHFKVENPPHTRVQDIFVEGKRLDPNETYPSAFITVQGVPQKYGTGRERTGLHAVAAMRKYAKTGPTCALQNTFQLV